MSWKALKRSHPSLAHYFTNWERNWYPLTEICIASVYIAISNEVKVRNSADSYIGAVRQETTMAKTGALPTYLYTNKITDAYLADMVVIWRGKGRTNTFLKKKVHEVENTEEEQAN